MPHARRSKSTPVTQPSIGLTSSLLPWDLPRLCSSLYSPAPRIAKAQRLGCTDSAHCLLAASFSAISSPVRLGKCDCPHSIQLRPESDCLKGTQPMFEIQMIERPLGPCDDPSQGHLHGGGASLGGCGGASMSGFMFMDWRCTAVTPAQLDTCRL